MAKRRTISQLVGKEVKKSRNKFGFTLQHVAKKTGLTASHLSKIERGECAASLDVMDVVCAFLQIDLGRVRGLRSFRAEEAGE